MTRRDSRSRLLLMLIVAILIIGGCKRTIENTTPVPPTPTAVSIESLIAPIHWTIIVRQNGPHYIHPEWFQSQGVEPESISVDNLALYDGDELVPVVYVDTETGTGILFVAETVIQRSGPSNGYTLVLGETGLEMTQDMSTSEDANCQNTTIAYAVFEENNEYRSTAPADVPWFWQALRINKEMEVILDLPDAIKQTAELTMTMWAQSQMPQDPDHHIRLLWDGEEFDDHMWDAQQDRERGLHTWTVTTPVVNDDAIALTIQSPGETEATVEMNWLDRIEVNWNRELRAHQDSWVTWSVDATKNEACFTSDDSVNGMVAILQAEDGSQKYLRTETLHVNQDGYDTGWLGVPGNAPQPYLLRIKESIDFDINTVEYLVIAHPQWHTDLMPLLDLRVSEDLSVDVVTPNQVYDVYGDGTPDVTAITEMVRKLTGEGALRYVMIVGQASADPMLVWNEPVTTIPTAWVRTSYVGDTSSDVALVADTEGKPLVAVGRIPASDNETLQTIVNKTISWTPNSRLAIVNDDEPQFERMSDTLGTYYEPDITINAGSENARSELLSWLREAQSVFVYTGHGSLPMLGDERILTFEDASGWQGPTVVVAWSCLCGTYAHPTHTGLGEAWLTGEDGTVAFVGPTGETTTAEQSAMASTFQEAMVAGDRIGDALLEAWNSSVSPDARMSFILLGDPALQPFPVID